VALVNGWIEQTHPTKSVCQLLTAVCTADKGIRVNEVTLPDPLLAKWGQLATSLTRSFTLFTVPATVAMPSLKSGRGLSSHEVRDLWRYAVDTDFHAVDTSIKTDEHFVSYGSEERFVAFDHPIDKSWFTYAMNSTGQWLAIPDKNNVDVYDLLTGERMVLSGHTSEVGTIGFSPTDPNLLVSYSSGMYGSSRGDTENDDIIIWNMQEQQAAGKSRVNAPIDQAAKVGINAAIAHLGDSLKVSSDDSDLMQDALGKLIVQCDIRSRVPSTSRLKGRISTSFQSPLFSNSGDYLIYGPGGRPRSNGDDTWDLCLYNLVKRTTTTLSGHRDSIMWTGFSPNDEMVASAGWDGYFRVHDLTGREMWKWDTEKQNWAAVFSPDGKYLAGTDGAGMVRIWDLGTGEETAKFDNGPRWCRTIDWSPDGKYIIVGSENHGRLRLFATSDGKLEMFQERSLSTKNCDLESLDPNVRRMVGGFLGVHTAQFLPPSDNNEGDGLKRLVHSVSMDEGIEVFDFDKGKKWRFVPPYDADGSVQMTKAGDGQTAVVGHIWMKEAREIGIIAADGIRFWRLE